MDWSTAATTCSGLNSSGYNNYTTGWRLPTRAELQSLYTNGFKILPISALNWTDAIWTSEVSGSDRFAFSDGSSWPNNPVNPAEVFCVRPQDPLVTIGAPSSAIVGTGGTVTFTVSYTYATSVTLTAGNITPSNTGNANATIGVSGCTTTSCLVTLSSFSGVGTFKFSIAAGTATNTAGGSAGAAGPSSTVSVNIWQDVTTAGTGAATCAGSPENCAYTLVSSGLTYSARIGAGTQSTAAAACTSVTYNGTSDWRLPTEPEFMTGLSNGMLGFLPGLYFGYHWTSTPSGGNFYYVFPEQGWSNTYSASGSFSYLCVSAASSGALTLGTVTSTSSSVSLTWSGGTPNYTAILFGGSGCSAGPTNHGGLSGTSDTFTGLLASTQYSVKVMDNTSAFTSCQNISTTAGGALTLGTLTPGSTTVDASWSGGTASYIIYLYSDSMCMTTVSFVNKGSSTTHQFTGLTASTTYYAKVTDGMAGVSPASGCTSVTTSGGGGGTLHIMGHLDLTGGAAEVTYTGDTSATVYLLRFYTDSSCSNYAGFDATGSGGSIMSSSLEPSTDYWVDIYNAAGTVKMSNNCYGPVTSYP